MPRFHDEGWTTSHPLLSALYDLISSSMCPWDVGPTANERGGVQTHISDAKAEAYDAMTEMPSVLLGSKKKQSKIPESHLVPAVS